MKTILKKNRRVKALAGDDLGLLVNLLRNEKIGYKMLLQNLAEVCADDYDLVVQAVLIITDKARLKATNISILDIDEAIQAVETADDFRGNETIIAALNEAKTVIIK